jgi:hypothetical protein
VTLLDPETLDSETPMTKDGRSYPEHLRPFKVFDDRFLPLLSEAERATFDDLSKRIANPKDRALLGRWLASAEWRGLIERRLPDDPGTYVLAARGASRLADAA